MIVIWPSCDPKTLASLPKRFISARLPVDGVALGKRVSIRHGRSHEFSDHRPYFPGDDVRQIDWRVLARTDKAYIKRFQAESGMRVEIVLDGSGSMNYRGDAAPFSKWDYARALTVALTYLATAQGDSVGLNVLGPDGVLLRVPRSANAGQWRAVRNALVECKAGKQVALGDALGRMAHLRGGRIAWLIVTDGFDATDSVHRGLASITSKRHEAVFFHVLDRDEELFPFEDALGFVDLETEEALDSAPTATADAYRAAFQQWRSRLRALCSRRVVEYVEMFTDGHLPNQLASWLTRAHLSSGVGPVP